MKADDVLLTSEQLYIATNTTKKKKKLDSAHPHAKYRPHPQETNYKPYE